MKTTLWIGLWLLGMPTLVAGQAKIREFSEAVKKIEARFEPAQAKRGQTVSFKLEVQLNDGWYTYPTVQTDPETLSSVNTIILPPPGDVIFVEPVHDPLDWHSKAEPSLKIKDQHYYPLGTTWEVKAVVSPEATPGKKKIELKRFAIIVCDKDNCLPPKKYPISAMLNVVDGPAVPIEGRFKDEVAKAVASRAAPPKVGKEALKKDDPSTTRVYDGSNQGPRAEGPNRVIRIQNQRIYQEDLDAVAAVLPPPGKVGGARPQGPTGADAASFITFLLTAMFWGGVTLLTPCVFPMIPITVSFFLKQAEKEHHSPVRMATVYTLTIIIVLGVSAIALLSVFQALSINPWMNVALGGLFVFFALSLFGMYDIVLPNFLVRFTSAREGKGGYAGTIFMAISFTIVSFTCVAPFLGGFSGMAATGNFNTVQLALGGIAFASAFAAPFFFLALFPSMLKKLPKSGSWLNTVKVVMGFLELAAALKFFRTAELRWQIPPAIFSFDFVLAMWIAIVVLMGLYLLNVYRLPHDEPQSHIGVPRMLFGFMSISLGIYLMPAVFTSGPEKPRPGGVIYAWVDSFLLPDKGEDWSGDLRAAIEDARAKNQPVFIDFTGVTCTNCRLNEHEVFTRPEVRELFQKFRLVQMYTDTIPPQLYDDPPAKYRRDDEAELNRAFEERLFGTIQLPLYVTLKPDPNSTKVEVVDVYPEGKINNVPAFVAFLKRPFEAK